MAALRIALARRQRAHLAWIGPFLVANGVSLLYRISYDADYYAGGSFGPVLRITWGVALQVANCVSFVGFLALLGLVRKDAARAVRDAATRAASDPHSWPPPPDRGSSA